MAPEKPSTPKVGERYRHYRTGKDYVVMDLVLHVSDGADVWHVIYASVEPNPDGINHFSRTEKDFSGHVWVDVGDDDRNSVRIPRFTKVEG